MSDSKRAVHTTMHGFDDPVQQAQKVFRQVLTAMSRPGRVVSVETAAAGLTPPGLSLAATAICLSLADFETPLWLDATAAQARDYLAFHCEAPVTPSPAQATFAVIADIYALDEIAVFNPGTDENPERSTTLIIEVAALATGKRYELTGPGIDGTACLHIEGVPDRLWDQLADNHSSFPLGMDLLLCCESDLVALPRRVRVVTRMP